MTQIGLSYQFSSTAYTAAVLVQESGECCRKSFEDFIHLVVPARKADPGQCTRFEPTSADSSNFVRLCCQSPASQALPAAAVV